MHKKVTSQETERRREEVEQTTHKTIKGRKLIRRFGKAIKKVLEV